MEKGAQAASGVAEPTGRPYDLTPARFLVRAPKVPQHPQASPGESTPKSVVHGADCRPA